MDKSDRRKFKDLMDATSEYYQRDLLSVTALKMYFHALERFEFNQIQEAVSLHIQQTKSGQFYPKVADLIELLEGGTITPDQIISEARLAQSPLGVLSRIKIGSWDLDRGDPWYLKQRAEECLLMLPEWKSRVNSGEYTDHEISILLKYNVDVGAPLRLGMSAPRNAEQTRRRARMIEQTPRHKYLIEPPYDPDTAQAAKPCPNGVAKISALISSVIDNKTEA